MSNLLEETIAMLKENDKSEKDVLWCGNKDLNFTWQHFITVANRDYDSGFGGQEIASDLLVVGEDFWMERHEYDGSEWWEYKQNPIFPDNEVNIKRIDGGSWDDIEDMINKDAN